MACPILAIDLGTTTHCAMLVSDTGEVLALERAPAPPWETKAPGLVEKDAEGLFQHALGLVRALLEKAGTSAGRLAGIGLTGQRASCVIWERSTGRPVTPLVGWQDSRGAKRTAELVGQGFELIHVQPAGKLGAILDALPGGRRGVEDGSLCFGTLDSYALARLAGVRAHITDASQAHASGFLDFETGGWNGRLLAAEGLSERAFATICDSWGHLARTAPEHLGAPVPILASLGDQQAACFAHGCRTRGDNKLTLGTSAILDVHTGSELGTAPGCHRLLQWRHDGRTEYALEGMIFTVGAAFDHLVRLGILPDVAGASALCESVPDAGGVRVLPALAGLGSPHLRPDRLAVIDGVSLATTKAHIVRATTEGAAFRARELFDALYTGIGQSPPEVLRVDGGAALNDSLLLALANATGRPVARISPIEATAYGAALAAGIAAGHWDETSVLDLRRSDRVFEPSWSADERETRFRAWREAFGL